MVIELHRFLINHFRVNLFQTLLLSKDAMFSFLTGHVNDLVSNDVMRLEEEAIKSFFSGSFTVVEVLLSSLLLVYF